MMIIIMMIIIIIIAKLFVISGFRINCKVINVIAKSRLYERQLKFNAVK